VKDCSNKRKKEICLRGGGPPKFVKRGTVRGELRSIHGIKKFEMPGSREIDPPLGRGGLIGGNDPPQMKEDLGQRHFQNRRKRERN